MNDVMSELSTLQQEMSARGQISISEGHEPTNEIVPKLNLERRKPSYIRHGHRLRF